ncbi:hypothetical protein KHA80_19010 [Anaerobacillus sp. HL2]|nr:hypothetical protein KHA80_19010 [Anaerobacillus sp. HL2]
MVDDWEQVLQQWLDQVSQFRKGQSPILFDYRKNCIECISEKNWPKLNRYSNRGLFIEKEKEATFEKLLKQISISIARHDLNVEAPKKSIQSLR